MFQRLLKRFKGGGRSPARVPEGMRVYTIGDIHGRADLLQDLHRMIQADASTTPSGTKKIAIYLGDYVDRGLHSRDVIDLLLDEPLEDFDTVYLKGNHDDVFLNFLDDESEGRTGSVSVATPPSTVTASASRTTSRLSTGSPTFKRPCARRFLRATWRSWPGWRWCGKSVTTCSFMPGSSQAGR